MSCVSVHSLITLLQLKKMSVLYESAQDAITFELLEMSSITSITTPNQEQFQIFVQGTFSNGFLRKISGILQSCIMKISQSGSYV